jgi:hypothetical protein
MAYPYGNYGAFGAPQAFYGHGGVNYSQPPQMPVTAPKTAANGPVVKLVTSREEVVSNQIPFDGSTTYFVDTSNGKIYAKTFDFNTGTAPIITYIREQETKIKYVTEDDLKELKSALDEIYNELERLRNQTKKAVD